MVKINGKMLGIIVSVNELNLLDEKYIVRFLKNNKSYFWIVCKGKI